MNHTIIAGIKVPLYNKKPGDFIRPSGLVETDTVVSNLKNILYPVLEGHPVLMVGDAGIGKNEMVYYINSRRNMPTYRFSFNEDTLPDDLIGSYHISHGTEKFTWTNGPLVNALQDSCTFVADEMNLTNPHILRRFASVYEEGLIDLTEGDGRRITAGAGFSFIATQNPQEGFEGRKALPAEITKYFTTVSLENYTPDELAFIIGRLYPDADPRIVAAAIGVCLKTEESVIRGITGKQDLEKFHFNLRTLKRLFTHLQSVPDSKFAINDIFSLYFLETFRSPDDRQYVQNLIEEELGSSVKTSTNPSAFAGIAQFSYNFPLTEKIGGFTSRIMKLVALNENILIEYSDDKPVKWYLDFLAGIFCKKIETVQLSRGMNTWDLLGSLRPDGNQVKWADGSLTRAVKSGNYILLKGIESAGAEITEKLNMLTDDARAIQLSPESGLTAPLELKNDAVVIALKPFRKNKSDLTISRAFRNRFTALVFPDIEDYETLNGIISFYTGDADVAEKMAAFHIAIGDMAEKKQIGAANLHGYRFGINHLIRWKDHVLEYYPELGNESLKRGVILYYINEISAKTDREKALELFRHSFPSDFMVAANSPLKKKTFTEPSAIEKQKWWDTEKAREKKERAPFRNSGKPLKKGKEINTPETGGNVKEGKDAWFGKETRGNKGSGEPGTGGGAWGYRTEELYKQFLAKRKNLLNYSIDADYDEFMALFQSLLEETRLNLEKLYDPEKKFVSEFSYRGNSIHAGRYVNFLNAGGNDKVFINRSLKREGKGIKNLEILFVINQSRRIFNFDYYAPTIATILVTTSMLRDHEIPYKIYNYFENKSGTVVFNRLETSEDYSGIQSDKRVFEKLSRGWEGDSVDEYRILDLIQSGSKHDSGSKIIIWLSDFRNRRGKAGLEDELSSAETMNLMNKSAKLNRQTRILAVGLGNREIAGTIFKNAVQVNDGNFFSMPNLIGTELINLLEGGLV